MRPVTLHVEGFGVFRSPVEISFDDVDYFALIGPTGAGKSTIIDALCFALYGSIPRYADERLVGRVVSLGAQQAKVSLTFDVSGARYRATRVVRLQKGKTAGDALLERVAGDGSSEVLAKNRSEMKPAMEQLLGLPFAHFTKCVVLPQGEFARFLHDEPAKRRELLVQLLDLDVYSRIGQRARERAKEEGRALELYEHQIDELAFATSEARDRAEQRVDALRDLYRAIDAACTDDDAGALAALDERATTAGHRARALAEVRMPERVDEINEAHAHAAATVERAAQVLALATTATEAADAALAGCPDPSVLERARDAHAALAALEPRVREAGAAVDAAAVEVARTEKLLAGARTLADEREAALQSARDAHAAHALA
ncbi:MAG TPA: SMC family ATPase, partial [Acidimicrobiia bacterium]|nr:SMC family ATPase [Acidimicrobiia bacterium]